MLVLTKLTIKDYSNAEVSCPITAPCWCFLANKDKTLGITETDPASSCNE